MDRILVVCTANQCRSPVAGAFLSRHAAERGADAKVLSAGLLESGNPAVAEVVALGPALGFDLGSHRSREVTDELIASAELIIGLTRLHVRELAVANRAAWPRTFTLRELVREGSRLGPRLESLSLADWIAPLHEARTPSDLLGADPLDDVADPMGGPPEGYEEMARDLADLTNRLADLLWPEEEVKKPEPADFKR